MNSIEIRVGPFSRGMHLITNQVQEKVEDLGVKDGIIFLHVLHTSAGICLNEAADPDVRHDLNEWMNRNIKENEPYYRHSLEGPDDMPAHIKAVLTGNSLSVPLLGGNLKLGTWQGIYFCEFRNHSSARKIQLSILEA